MKFIPAKLAGVWLIDLELREDNRGFFARTYCEDEFRAHGLNTNWPQCNLTLTLRRGTLRRHIMECEAPRAHALGASASHGPK